MSWAPSSERSSPRLASVSVDLDDLSHYCAIHGLPGTLLDARAREAVYECAVPRFAELFAEFGLQATWFAVGDDLRNRTVAAKRLAELARSGEEIGSHSGAHDYRLSRLPREMIRADLERGHRAIGEATGSVPEGFRAPGYTLSAELISELIRLGYRYDSSTLPSAPYYLAKAAVRAWLRLSGAPSGSIQDHPRVLWAPRKPYRPSVESPYREGNAPIVELPISVSPFLGWPLVGTFAVGSMRGLTAWAYRGLRAASGLRHLNLELHAVDLLDLSDGIPQSLAAHQRDLSVGWRLKRERLAAILSRLRTDFEVRTLGDAARALEGELSGA